MQADQKAEAIRLRTEERLSLGEILTRLAPPRSTVAGWIRPHPLNQDEIHQRLSDNGKVKGRGKWEPRESEIFKRFGDKQNRHNKAKVAEAAVMLRLLLLGCSVYGSPFDGDKADWVVEFKGRFWKVQVKWAVKHRAGAPSIKLVCSNGRRTSRPYQEGEVDLAVAYDLHTDAAYVWTWEQVAGRQSLSCTEEAKERWDIITEA